MTNEKVEKVQNLSKALYEFAEILKKKNGFNLFDTLRISQNELKNSTFLAWLMNPTSDHNLGGLYLKILFEDLNDKLSLGLDVNSFDYSIFKVEREIDNIDIKFYSEREKIVVAIENKINSSESGDQLERYEKIIKERFNDFRHVFIYLTARAEESSNPDLWKPYNYQNIESTIQRLQNEGKPMISKDVCLFLDHYVSNLRRNILGDNELKKKCIEIYKEHMDTFKLILSNLQDSSTYYKEAIIKYLRDKENVILDTSSNKLIRFTTRLIDDAIPKEVSPWTKSGRLFLFEIENFENEVNLKSVVGPSKNDERDRLLAYMAEKDNGALFPKAMSNRSTRYSHVNAERIVNKEDCFHLDEEDIKTELFKELDSLFICYIMKVEEILKDYKV